VLATIGPRQVDEHVNLNFGVMASDPDLTIPALSAVNLPANATFVDNGDGTGIFDFTPSNLQAGVYDVTFFADDGQDLDSEVVQITVNDVNQPPVLDPIGPLSVIEAQNLNYIVSASDIDGTIPTLSTSTLPPNATFIDAGDGTGTFDFTPDFTQAGVVVVTFYASDGLTTDSEQVSITITEAGNQVPVLDPIGSRTVVEGQLLDINITSFDPDGTTPTLTATGLPSGASFTDNGDATGTLNWTPDFTQAGTYSVTFFASDGSLSDSEIVSITVTEAGNQTPILSTTGAKTTTEGILLSFTVSASDPDGSIPALTATGLPTGASFVDNGDGTGGFGWTPDFTQAGIYDVTFYASDGSLSDSEVVTITVGESGNQAPVLTTISPQTTTENVNLGYNVSATDPDGTTPSLSAINLPAGASFTDNGDGTGTFDWTPGFTQAGAYSVTFIASDGVLTDSKVGDITVLEAGNQAPVLASTGSQSTAENLKLNFVVSATDPDATTPGLSAANLPAGATFSDHGDGTGTFDWTPGFTDAGTYNVTFIASDGSLSDSEIVEITVLESGNQAPLLATIGSQSTTEDVNLNFMISATDPDGTIPSLSASGMPAGATFTDNGDGTGTFDWIPSFTEAGTHTVTFAASDGVLTDSEIVVITVLEAGNQTPLLATIGPKSTNEDVNLNFTISATDPDGTVPVLHAAGIPAGATFVDNGDGSGIFDWIPDFTQAGSYNVTFIATDGVLSDSEIVTITVNEAGNQTPVLAEVGAQGTTENVDLLFVVSANDPDGTTPTMSASELPAGATFVDNGDGTGTFDWTPGFIQAGTYDVTFIASDGILADSEIVTITVLEAGNQTPRLTAIGAKSTTENVNLTFTVSASDPDATIPVVSAVNLPAGATFVDNGDGTGLFDWTPDFTMSGVYGVTFIASDGSLSDSEVVSITVVEAGNQAPLLAAIGNRSTTEDINLNFTISANDPDTTTPVLSATGLPGGATFMDNGDGSGLFDWTPDFTDAGTYDITFIASDGSLSDSELVTVTVIEAGNQAPILAEIGSRATTEDVTLNFTVSATDPDAATPALSASGLPIGATFVDNGDGTGLFDWTPDFTQAGSYNVTFIASDGALSDSEVVAITVLESGNQAPVLASIGAKSTTEDINLNFAISATDPDGTTPLLSVAGLPAGALFTDNGDGTGNFDWKPTFTDAGSYNVVFIASDLVLADSEIVVISVLEAGNQAPILASIGPRSTTENINLNFTISASDPDGTVPALSVSGLPSGATFVDNGDGTGLFDWTPNYTDAGTYDVMFFAADAELSDLEVVTISVLEAGDQTPVLAAIGSF